MRLSELLHGLGASLPAGADVEVEHIAIDSRDVRPGTLYVARRGYWDDGHRYIEAAVRAGAVAVVVSDPSHPGASASVPVAVVAAEDPFLGLLSERFYRAPTRALRVWGVTGTNGKTSTSFLLEHLLQAHGERVAVMGTINYRFAGTTRPAPNTTPDGLVIQRFAREVLDRGATALVMEVSSHALQIGRVAGVAFDVVGFSNLTQDHLDYHGTMEAYAAAKRRLFSDSLVDSMARGKRPCAVAIVDGPWGRSMLDAAPTGVRRLSVSARGNPAELRLACVEARGALGMRVSAALSGAEFPDETRLVGLHNLENAALAIGMATRGDLSLMEPAMASLRTFPGVPGRMEAAFAPRSDEPAAFVDYAHTPDAVARAAEVIRSLGSEATSIVLGCGGDRDPSKRGPMARAALDGASEVVLTSDNPRSENPEAILDSMESAVRGDERVRVQRVADRSDAIAVAIAMNPPRTVLLAGKGHEAYQEIRGVRFHLDDGEEARRALVSRNLALPFAGVPLLSGWTAERLAASVAGELIVRAPRRPLGTLRTDSRQVREGDILFALRGERFDGHDFLGAAVDAGAGLCVVSSRERIPAGAGCAVVLVDDTLAALGRLAAALAVEARARRGGLRIIGVTGSNGKTTTKEILRVMLEVRDGAPALVTHGNLNNEIGLPLTISGLTSAHRSSVLEMGAGKPGDIAELVRIAPPDVGVVTSIAPAHVERLGSVDGVRREKSEIGRSPRTKALVLPFAEREYTVWKEAVAQSGATLLTFGERGATLEVVRETLDSPTRLFGSGPLDGWSAEIELPLPGLHNAHNLAAALLAAAVGADGALAPVASAEVAEAARRVTIPGGRLRRFELAGRHVIDDSYNANPGSVAATLSVLAAAPAPRIAVLGDMLELGNEEERLHRDVGARAAECADAVLGFGPRASWIVEGASDRCESVHFSDPGLAAEWLARNAPGGSTLLFKGSRGARVERVLDELARRLQEA